MITNKRGLSAIVTTMLIVLLVLVAVGIVWAVVSGLLETGSEGIDIGAKCLNIDVAAVAANCPTPATCSVVVERTGSNTDSIAGVKIVMKDSSTEEAVVADFPGNIKILATNTTVIDATGLTTPNIVEVKAYFVDASGNERLCDKTTSFSF